MAGGCFFSNVCSCVFVAVAEWHCSYQTLLTSVLPWFIVCCLGGGPGCIESSSNSTRSPRRIALQLSTVTDLGKETKASGCISFAAPASQNRLPSVIRHKFRLPNFVRHVLFDIVFTRCNVIGRVSEYPKNAALNDGVNIPLFLEQWSTLTSDFLAVHTAQYLNNELVHP